MPPNKTDDALPATDEATLETGDAAPITFDANVTPPADPAPDVAPPAEAPPFVMPPEQAAEVNNDPPPSDPLLVELEAAAEALSKVAAQHNECVNDWEGFRAEMAGAEAALGDARARFNGACARFYAGN